VNRNGETTFENFEKVYEQSIGVLFVKWFVHELLGAGRQIFYLDRPFEVKV